MITLQQVHIDFATKLVMERGVGEIDARARCAAKVYLNPVKWTLDTNDGDLPEFDDFIDVRVAHEMHHGMWLSRYDSKDRAYLLIDASRDPEFTAAGWMWGRDAIHDNFMQGGAYHIPRERGLLRNPIDLIDELRRRQANRAPSNTPTSEYAAYWDEEGRLHTPCYLCGKPNSGWGFGVSARRGEPGRWFCNEHRPREAVAGQNKQGELTSGVGA